MQSQRGASGCDRMCVTERQEPRVTSLFAELQTLAHGGTRPGSLPQKGKVQGDRSEEQCVFLALTEMSLQTLPPACSGTRGPGLTSVRHSGLKVFTAQTHTDDWRRGTKGTDEAGGDLHPALAEWWVDSWAFPTRAAFTCDSGSGLPEPFVLYEGLGLSLHALKQCAGPPTLRTLVNVSEV